MNVCVCVHVFGWLHAYCKSLYLGNLFRNKTVETSFLEGSHEKAEEALC